MNTVSTVSRDINDFLKRPLIIWAESVIESKKLTYESLINSTCFHGIIRSIDPRLQNSRLPNEASDTSSRLVNLDFILRSIRSFVQDVLRYLIVAKLPNIYSIAHDPYAEYSFDEIERILLLLLACSISGGDRKDIHIHHLTTLDESIQQGLMPQIEEFTEEINTILQPQECFFIDEKTNSHFDIQKYLKLLSNNLIRIVDERDSYFEEILELEQDKYTLREKLEIYQSSSTNLTLGNTTTNGNSACGGTNLHSTPSQTSLNTFLNDLETKNPGIEITEYKNKMRQMKFDLDDKMDTIETMRDEIDVLQTELNRIKNENIELTQSARLARLYRDEIDTLSEKVTKMDKCEQELVKYKGRLDEVDTLKSRIEELQNENHLLAEVRIHLEQQIEDYRSRIQEILQSEIDVAKFKHDVEKIAHERDLIQDKLSTILEDKTRLEFDLHSTSHTVETLNDELRQVKSRSDIDETRSLSVSLQIQQTIKNRLLKYDIDNKQLNDELTTLKERYEIDMHMKRIDAEKQTIHVQLLNEQLIEYMNDVKRLEMINDQLAKEKLTVQTQLQDNRIEFDQIRGELQATNNHLKLTLTSMQQREQMETNAKFEDIEQENKRLHDRIGEMMQQISQLQIEHDHLSIVKERECALNERVINLQLKYDQLARDHLSNEKRCQMYELNLKHYETLEHDYLELKHNNECYLRQINHLNQLETTLIDNQLNRERLEKENNEIKIQLNQLQQHIQIDEENYRQLQNECFMLKQRYDDKEWEELTQKLNEAGELSRQVQIKLKKKHDETESLKKKLANSEAIVEKLRQDLGMEINLREVLQSKLLQDTSQEASETEEKTTDEKRKTDEVAEMQQRLNLALKSDKVNVSIQRSLKQTIETLNHHVRDLQSDKARLQFDLQQALTRIDTLQIDFEKKRKLCEQIENDRSATLNSCHHLQQTNDQLILDHDQLQKLYTKLEYELDTTMNQLSDQRTTNRMLSKECKYLQTELNNIGKERQDLSNRVSHLLSQLHTLEGKLAEQKPFDEQYLSLQRQFQKRTDDLQESLTMNHQLKKQLDEIKLDLSKTRSELASTQMKYTNVLAQYGHLITKYEFLEQQSDRTEEEKSQLIEQLHNLVQQNQNVLSQALNNKDLFHEEARGYIEQLHQLMRQKELLEMKIMEQYKNMQMHKPRRSRGLIQSVSRKTRNILDRLANRRTRTSSADGQLYPVDSCDRAISPSLLSMDKSHARSTTPDVISSSLTSARQHQPELFKRQSGSTLHQSTDSLADSTSSKDEEESPVIIEDNAIKSSTPIPVVQQSKTSEFILNETIHHPPPPINGHRQSPFRPIRDSPCLQRAIYDLSPMTSSNQRRCSSSQSLLIHAHNNNSTSIHNSMRRHRTGPSPLPLKPSHLIDDINGATTTQEQQQRQTPLNDRVLITEFGAI